MYWPVLAGDDLNAYQTGYLISGGAAAGRGLAGAAGPGERGRRPGRGDAHRPLAAVGARLASVAAVAAGAFAVAVRRRPGRLGRRGGRGTPDLRLLADGALAVVLGGLGRRWPSAGSAAPAGSVAGGAGVGRLSGTLALHGRRRPRWRCSACRRCSLQIGPESAEFGFVPDPLWPHLGYLARAGAAGRRRPAGPGRPRQRPAPAAGAGAGRRRGRRWCWSGRAARGWSPCPSRLVVLGPDRADWKPLAEADRVLVRPVVRLSRRRPGHAPAPETPR